MTNKVASRCWSAVLLLAAIPVTARAEGGCDSLLALRLPDVRIADAKAETAPVPHCRANGVVGREIRFAIWLPQDWNGRFVMGGAGGFAGSVENQAMALGALQKGYATAGTDTGHQGTAIDGSWALGNLERIVNYGHAAVHRVTEVSKAIVRSHYGRDADKSFFAGCSNGGRQALMAAQRYPEDFDSIIAGAPANDLTGTIAGFVHVTQRMYPDPANLGKPILGSADRAALRKAIVAQCDGLDGIEDDVLHDPRACSFDPKKLACGASGNADDCLSAEELAAVEAIYGGAHSPAGRLSPGYPLGGEDKDGGWGMWLAGREGGGMAPGIPTAAYGFGLGFMRNFVYHDPSWSYAGYDFSTFERDLALVAASIDATNPDLSAFRERGGKLLIYHGWSDSALTALGSIDYVEAVYAKDSAAKQDVRLFLMPGVLHCAGGPGPDRVDFLAALEAWEAGGPAPDELEAQFRQGGGGRKVCAYPKHLRFLGGDPRDPSRFACEE
jgi:pimeloyl-ACP methyl ester carboxylesterase